MSDWYALGDDVILGNVVELTSILLEPARTEPKGVLFPTEAQFCL